MELKKKDFIEVEFTGRIKGGAIFDSNIKKDLEEAKLDIKAKPFIFSLGEGMFIKGVDDFLIGKDTGNYKIEVKPEDAFGKRNSQLVQMMPMKVFIEQKLNPTPGAIFNFDGRIAKVLTASGGRIMVDFNHPMAGKEVVYNLNILRKIEDINEKIRALNEFLFQKDFKFDIKEKKIVMQVEKPMAKFVELFKDKFKEIFELDLEVEEIKETKEKTEKKDSPKTQ